jgi:transcriptional regulator with XRE-family HTH domain
MSDKARFAKNLRVMREAADLTQAQLAEAIGKSRGSVIAWEDPERATMPSEADLATVAAVLKTTNSQLRYGPSTIVLPHHGGSGSARRETELPRQLRLMALDFEREALQKGADEPFMRYVRSSFSDPDFVALFAGGPDESPMTAEEAIDDMKAHIAELRAILKTRLARARRISGKLAPGLDE